MGIESNFGQPQKPRPKKKKQEDGSVFGDYEQMQTKSKGRKRREEGPKKRGGKGGAARRRELEDIDAAEKEEEIKWGADQEKPAKTPRRRKSKIKSEQVKDSSITEQQETNKEHIPDHDAEDDNGAQNTEEEMIPQITDEKLREKKSNIMVIEPEDAPGSESESEPEFEQEQEQERARPEQRLEQDFNIKEEELEQINGFNELTYGQKFLVLENLDQLLLRKVQEEAPRRHKEQLKKFEKKENEAPGEPKPSSVKLREGLGNIAGRAGTLLHNVRTNFMKKWKVAKLEKATVEEIREGKYKEDILKSLEQLTVSAENGPDVEVIKTEEGINLEVQYLQTEQFDNQVDREKAKEFNQAASAFSKMPAAWALDTAQRSERIEYQRAKDKYENIRTGLADVITERNLKDSESLGLGEDEQEKAAVGMAMAEINKISGDVQMNQFLNTHPDVEKELLSIKNKNVIKHILKKIPSEKGVAFLAGGLSRWTARGALTSMGSITAGSVASIAALPALAVGFGAWRGRIREKEKIREKAKETGRESITEKQKTKEERGKKLDELERLKIYNNIKIFESFPEITEEKKEEYREEIVEAIKSYARHNTSNYEGMADEEMDIHQVNEALMEEFKDIEEGKINMSESELRKSLNVKKDMAEVNYVDSNLLSEKIEKLVNKIDAEENREEQEKLINSLKLRINYTNSKVEDGLVNFGANEEVVGNNYGLTLQLSQAMARLDHYGYRVYDNGIIETEDVTFDQRNKLSELFNKKYADGGELTEDEQTELSRLSKMTAGQGAQSRVESFSEQRKKTINLKQRDQLAIGMLKGALFAAGFYKAGEKIMEHYGDNIKEFLQKGFKKGISGYELIRERLLSAIENKDVASSVVGKNTLKIPTPEGLSAHSLAKAALIAKEPQEAAEILDANGTTEQTEIAETLNEDRTTEQTEDLASDSQEKSVNETLVKNEQIGIGESVVIGRDVGLEKVRINISKEVAELMRERNIQFKDGALNIGDDGKLYFVGEGESKGVAESITILKQGENLKIAIIDTDGSIDNVLLGPDNNIINQEGSETPETAPQEGEPVAGIIGEETAEAAEPGAPEASAVEIKTKGIDTLSEAVEEYFKQEGVSDSTKDNFIKHWLGDETKIGGGDRKQLLNKAIKMLSIGSVDMNDNIENVKNLVYEGNTVSINADGTVEVARGGGISEAKMVSEAELRQNAEALKAKAVPAAEETAPAPEEAPPAESASEGVPPPDNLPTAETMEQIMQAQAEVRVGARVEEIYKWKAGPFAGDQIEEWAEVKNRPAEEILDGEFGEPVGELDRAEINNREDLQKYAVDARELIGDAGQDETMQEFAQRYETEVVKGAEELENKIFKTEGVDARDLIKIPSGERIRIIQDYYQTINGLDDASAQADLIRVLYNPNNHNAITGLTGEYNNGLFKGMEARLSDNGNLKISYSVRGSEVSADLIITKNGKIAVDGYLKNNWPNGVDVDNPTEPFNRRSLGKAMDFINKGGFAGKLQEGAGEVGDGAEVEVPAEALKTAPIVKEPAVKTEIPAQKSDVLAEEEVAATEEKADGGTISSDVNEAVAESNKPKSMAEQVEKEMQNPLELGYAKVSIDLGNRWIRQGVTKEAIEKFINSSSGHGTKYLGTKGGGEILVKSSFDYKQAAKYALGKISGKKVMRVPVFE